MDDGGFGAELLFTDLFRRDRLSTLFAWHEASEPLRRLLFY